MRRTSQIRPGIFCIKMWCWRPVTD